MALYARHHPLDLSPEIKNRLKLRHSPPEKFGVRRSQMDNSDKKTVATIDINIQWPTRKEWLEESLEEHFHCVLCGSPLAFKHKTDFLAGSVTEDANCTSCGVRTRQSSHSLQ